MLTVVIIALILLLIFCFTAFTGAPYVPSLKSNLKIAFTKLYPLSKTDTLIDLGSGGGQVLRVAEKSGAKLIGVELNPILALVSKLLTPRAKIVVKNYYNYDFPKEATVVYVFGDSRDIEKIYRKVKTEATHLRRPLYLISLAFDLKEQKPLRSSGPYYLYKILPSD